MEQEKQDANISLNWISLIKPADYSIEEINKKLTIFNIEPLERGFGVTLGNSLRRILLSYLQGTAICAVRISGIDHEYSTINNVVEDVVEIILNLKSIVIKGNTGYNCKKFTLNTSKKGSYNSRNDSNNKRF